jgi:general secretion pathway protein B
MSYILDALTKAAQQRDRQVPVVQRLLSPAPRPRAGWNPASRRLLAALAVNVVLLAGALAWWMWPTPATTPPATSTQPEPAAAPAPIAENPRPLKLEPLPSIEKRAEKPAAASSEPRASIPGTPTPAGPSPASSAAVPSPRAAADFPTPNAPSSAKAPTSRARAATPAPTTAPSALPRSGTPDVQSPATAAPRVAATPPPDASGLKLEALIYADVSAERMVFINGRRYREGDSIDGRWRLEEIREDGVELSDQGRRFSLRARR